MNSNCFYFGNALWVIGVILILLMREEVDPRAFLVTMAAIVMIFTGIILVISSFII